MPYASNTDLPESVRDVLPVEAQTAFRTIVNDALEQYNGDESRAFATAWAGLRNAGWSKDGDNWVKKAEQKTNFPGAGDNQKIALSNSKFPQFPYDYASNIKESHPEVWSKGGNEFGNQAFVLWGKARGGDDSEAVQNWIKRRERFMNRHQSDFQIAGVVAVMKWGGVVNKGLSHMKATMNEAKEKLEKADTWSTEFEVRKVDDERRFVFGWANIAIRADGEQIKDYQKDIIDPEDLELAGYDFVLNSRETGEMHQGGAKGHMIESFVVTAEKLQKMGLAPGALPQGWWVGFWVPDDEAWAKVKDKTYTMFSIEGSAVREELA